APILQREFTAFGGDKTATRMMVVFGICAENQKQKQKETGQILKTSQRLLKTLSSKPRPRPSSKADVYGRHYASLQRWPARIGHCIPAERDNRVIELRRIDRTI